MNTAVSIERTQSSEVSTALRIPSEPVTTRHRSTLACSALVTSACLLSCLCLVLGSAARLTSPYSPTPTLRYVPTPTYPRTLTPTSAPSTGPDSQTTERHLRIFSELWEIVHDEYLYPDYNGVDWETIGQEYRARVEAGLSDELFWITMDQMLVELNDEHSIFLSPPEAAEEDQALSGELDYIGAGIYSTIPLEIEKKYTVVLQVFPGSPADQAGLRPHDRILTVDDHPACCDAASYSAMERLSGPEGRQVELEVQTPGEPSRTVSVTLARIQGSLPVETRMLEGNIGYVLIPTLWDDTLTAEGKMAGLIIDLRTNSGGIDSTLTGLLAFFTDGKLGHFVGRKAREPLFVNGTDISGSQHVPLIILVGRETASFAEVFSGVLYEVGRARLVGRTTLGNVEILYGYDFKDGSRAWIAQETFRPPSGTDWEKTGIIPNVEIPLDWGEFTTANDPQLEAALDLLRSDTEH